MRKLAVAAALASTALAGPALARDGTWYAGLHAGGLLVEDVDFDTDYDDESADANVNDVLSIDHEYGYDIDGVVGYDFGAFRGEFEVAWKDANIDVATINAPSDLGFPNQPARPYEGADGNTRVLSFMVNALFDFGGDDGFGAYAGGGVGIARVEASQYDLFKGFGPTIADDSDTGFAWQLIAGVRANLSEYVDLDLKYRYFNGTSFDIIDEAGVPLSADFASHSLLVGLIYNFYTPPPPPPPPPAPVEAPPPPPPPPPPPAPGPFIVFFDWDKADITPEAASILDRAAESYAQTGQASVMLAGHADKSGSPQYNVGLSERRAAAVRDYLVGKGVPGGVITSEAFGESRPLVETADGVREPQNRRVEINFGGGAAPAM